MTEEEARLAADLAQQAMVYELEHCGTRSYAQMSERVHSAVFDKLMNYEQARRKAEEVT